MAVIQLNQNAISGLRDTLRSLITDKNVYMRPVVFGLTPLVRERIHVQGQRANGAPLGTYSNSYLKIRQKRNRGKDVKVVASLTRQMENDMVPVAEENEYGIGYTNSHNYDKATYVEDMYPGTFELSQQEMDMAVDYIIDILNGMGL